MKLFMCKHCKDLVTMSFCKRHCVCGKSQGRYLNQSDVEVSGPSAVLGISNDKIIPALYASGSVDFGMFTIDERTCSSVRRHFDDMSESALKNFFQEMGYDVEKEWEKFSVFMRGQTHGFVNGEDGEGLYYGCDIEQFYKEVKHAIVSL
jgi:hypothetical protein